MNILYGLLPPIQGEMGSTAKLVQIHSSADAIACGIGMVHQHFMLVPNFTVLENVMLGSEGGAVSPTAERGHARDSQRSFGQYGMEVDPHAVIERSAGRHAAAWKSSRR